ncbi:hypothetical protein HRF87_27685 [Bacillus sp. CRN 9]|nr:hypothetical protein [Bacillus sp. CRN 9]
MKFQYQNNGDILYGLETFRFRYNGHEAATIKILNLLDDNQFAFDFEISNSIAIPDE